MIIHPLAFWVSMLPFLYSNKAEGMFTKVTGRVKEIIPTDPKQPISKTKFLVSIPMDKSAYVFYSPGA